MNQLISFKTDKGHTVYLETTTVGGGMQPIARDGGEVVKKAADTLSEALEPVRSVSQSILNAFTDFAHAPDELSVELSIKITAEAGIIITKGSLEGNFKINLKWKRE